MSLQSQMPSQTMAAMSTGLGSGMDVVNGAGGIAAGMGGEQQHADAPGSLKASAAQGQRWTDEQSTRLRELVEETGAKDWTNISKQVSAVCLFVSLGTGPVSLVLWAGVREPPDDTVLPHASRARHLPIAGVSV